LKKVLCALILVQGRVSRRRDLNAVDYLPLKLMNGKKEEFITGAIGVYLAGRS
jgi:hypothetical protein